MKLHKIHGLDAVTTVCAVIIHPIKMGIYNDKSNKEQY